MLQAEQRHNKDAERKRSMKMNYPAIRLEIRQAFPNAYEEAEIKFSDGLLSGEFGLVYQKVKVKKEIPEPQAKELFRLLDWDCVSTALPYYNRS
jgi:hypothetical protein